MSWWTIFRQTNTDIFRPQLGDKNEKGVMGADVGALRVIATVCVPIIITIGALSICS